jgi:hypothetical protein
MIKVLILVSSIFVGLAINVQAANVTFDPAEANFKVAPGEETKTTLTVNGSSTGPFHSLYFTVGAKLGNGNIPPSWLNPTNVSLYSRTGGSSSSTMDLIVNIPPDAATGYYSGQLLPETNTRSTESIFSDGVNVSIEVVAPQTACLEPPDISIVELKPYNIWAPTDTDIEVEIAGVISAAEGCEVIAGYSLESNDGTIKGDITLDTVDSFRKADGSFRKKVKINVSRSGKDKSGRVYNGTVHAKDAGGNESTVPFSVTVLHDKGNKIGATK